MVTTNGNKYEPVTTATDPEITLKIPSNILRDLVLRAEENGSSIELEFATRLARTLERDLEMIDDDNLLAVKAFERVLSDKDFAMQIFSKQQEK